MMDDYCELYSTLSLILDKRLELIDSYGRIDLLLNRSKINVLKIQGTGNSYCLLDVVLDICEKQISNCLLLLDLFLTSKVVQCKITKDNKWRRLINPCFSKLDDDVLFTSQYNNICITKILLDNTVSNPLFFELRHKSVISVYDKSVISVYDKPLFNVALLWEIKRNKTCKLFTKMYSRFLLAFYPRDILKHIIYLLTRLIVKYP